MAQVTFTSLEKLIHLLSSAPLHKGTYVRVLGPSQLGLGDDPLHPSHTLDLARESVVHSFDDEAPMDLHSSLAKDSEESAANGTGYSNATTHQPQSKTERQKKIDPAAQTSNSKLRERLETGASGKRT